MISFWIPLLALVGLADAGYLLYKKVRKEKLTCFLGDDCDRVTKSKYGYTAGIPNEILGIGFYLSCLFLFGLSFLGHTFLLGISLNTYLVLAAIPASLASLYLIGVQAFILKEWCEYCLLSAAVNFLILAIALA